MIIPGICKFCGLTLQLNVADDCPTMNVAKWLPIAACDKCADFRMSLLKLGDKCDWVLGKVHDAQRSKTEGSVRSMARDQLTELTKRVMRVICDHYRVTNHWDSSFVDGMIENPNRVKFMISHMRETVRKSKERLEKVP